MRQFTNETVERGILGSILLDNAKLFEAEETLRAADFGLDSHRRIFQRMADLLRAGSEVDTLTLQAELAKNSEVEAVGGLGYLARLTEGLPRFTSIKSWAGIVGEESRLRQLHRTLQSSVAAIEEPGTNCESVMQGLESRLLDLRALGGSVDLTIAHTAEQRAERFSADRTRKKGLVGLTSGVDCFDRATKGLRPGQIVQFGARTSQGKTCFLTQAAVANCLQGIPVLLFSLEMTKEQLTDRIYAVISGVPFFKIDDPSLASDEDEAAINAASKVVAKWPLMIAAESKLDLHKIIATARVAIRRHAVKLVGVDYCQIVKSDIRDVRERITQVSRALTDLARDEGVAVLALSQLTRPGQSGADSPPTVNELRESSQLENDAHVVALLHRPWDKEERRAASSGELIIAKNRGGETGTYPIVFNRRSLTLSSPAESRPR